MAAHAFGGYVKLIQGAVILLLSSCAIGQTAPTKNTQATQPKTSTVAHQPSAAAPKHEDAAKVAITADSPVITVSNVCGASAKDCKTIVTRKEFETMLLGLSGGEMVAPEMPKRFATQYAEMLVFATEAEKNGFDKEAQTDAAIRFARIQVLAQRYLRTLQEKSQPTPEELQKYYDMNQAQFQGVSLDRIMIPTGHAKSKKPEELTAMAEDMKKRLAAGEDADKLQQEIYTALNLTGPPKTSVTLRHGNPEQEALVDLPSGAVSDVITEQMALLVYRSHGKKPLPLELVKDDIFGKVYQQKLRASVAALMSNHKSVLNDAYFGPVEMPKNPHE